MLMKLETVYNIKAIPIIRNFVIESAKFFGANTQECNDLELVSEEAAEHIISNFPAEENAMFEIVCELRENGSLFRIILGNKGLPVDEENLPQYQVEKPQESIDGLKFFLIEQLTDHFYFRNCGADGWQTVLEKQLSTLSLIKEEKEEIDKNSVVSKKLELDFGRGEDAYEITKLAYLTYRYTYAKTIFYYPELLKESIQNGNVVSFVIRNSENEIVAHAAYMRSPFCRDIAEAGAMMSRPEYRHTSAIMRLAKAQYNYPIKHDNSIAIVEANLITAHTGTQRICKVLHFCPMALKISVHERAEFIDIDDISPQRESLLYTSWVPHSIDPVKIYAPEQYVDFIAMLLENAGIEREVVTETAPATADTNKLFLDKNEAYSLATMLVERIGYDWKKKIKTMIKDLSIDGFATIHLQIPAHKPIPQDLDRELRNVGFFFSGIIPIKPNKWVLLYTYLNNQKIDFEQIKLCDEVAFKLRDFVESCYNELNEI